MCSTNTTTTSSTISTSVHLTILKDVPVENEEKWLAYAAELSQETWKEAGCLAYDFVRSSSKKEATDNVNRFVIIEEWASQAHLDAHAATPHFQRLVPLMDALSKTADMDISHKAVPTPKTTTATTNPTNIVVEDSDNRFRRDGRILVLYDTSTGSTGDMAVLIAEGARLLDRMDVRIRVVPGAATSWEKADAPPRDATHPFATFDDVYWADAVAAGTPTNLGCISYRMKQFWDDFSQQGGWSTTDAKIGTAFTSQGGHGGGGELACMAMQTVLLNFGFSIFGITDYVGFLDTMHYGSAIAKKPRNEMDKMKCRRQGLRLAEFVAYYINGRDEAHPKYTKEWETKRWGFPGIPPKRADPQEIYQRTNVPHVSLQSTPGQEATPTISTVDGATTHDKKKALIFTKMEDYVHDSTPAMAAWVYGKLMELGWQGVVTDDSSHIDSAGKMATYDLVIFLNNSGQIFHETENLMRHVKEGKPVMGVHAAIASFLNGKDASGATLMEPTCDVFETIFGCHFRNHPPVQTGTVVIEHDEMRNRLAPLVAALPSKFEHTDEFFNFTKNVAVDKDLVDDVHVLAWVDEASYDGGLMGKKHPIAWYREMDSTKSNLFDQKKARVFYCGLGHFSHFYNGTGSDRVSIILEAGLRYCCGLD